jgi:hypothetical protein
LSHGRHTGADGKFAGDEGRTTRCTTRLGVVGLEEEFQKLADRKTKELNEAFNEARRRASTCDQLGIGCFGAPFPAPVAPTIPMTVPFFSAVTSRQFGGSRSPRDDVEGRRGGVVVVGLSVMRTSS